MDDYNMSQTNIQYPFQLSFTDTDMDLSMGEHSFSLNDSMTWTQDLRPMSQPIPSPTDSIQASWPMSLPLNAQSTIPQDLSGAFTGSQYNTHLAPPRTRTSVDHENIFPVNNYTNDGPWSAFGMRTSGQNASPNRFGSSAVSYRGFHHGPGSEMGSTAKSDSGYFTKPTGSVLSHELERRDQELPTEITQKVGNMNVSSVTSEPPEMRRMPSDQKSVSQQSVRSATRGKQLLCRVKDCGQMFKCQSDLKKHMLRHEKPFRCDFPDCPRVEGFTTCNDLDRHKKSLHKIGLDEKSYMCASEKCKTKTKIWPRLDNFKQHIERIHKGENEEDLIRRSEDRASESRAASKNLMLTASNDALTGVGTGSSSMSNLDETISPLSLTSGHNMSRLPSYKGSPGEFAMNVHPQTTQTATSASQEDTMLSKLRVGVRTRRNGPLTQRDSLNVPHSAAPNHQSLEKQPSEPLPQLSNAPQTKSDQQRQAYRKSARINNGEAKTHSSIPDKAKLEQIVYEILSEGSSPEQAAQTIVSRLLEQIAKPTSAPLRRSTPETSSSSTKPIRCPICDSQVSRICDLNKHIKRHKKPYGCTYPQCNKIFGAKSDWKRHENSQHFQLEAYRCLQVLPSTQKVCGKHFYRAEIFKEHLSTEHSVAPTQMPHHLKRSKIGKNCQVQHWCGFCQEIRPLKEKRNEAWDERFDHIARHFEKEKKSIDDWLCAEANKTKKQLLDEMHRDAFDDEQETPGKDSPEGALDVDMDATGESDDGHMYQPPPPIVFPSGERKRKRTATPSPQPLPPDERALKKRLFMWECCRCPDREYHQYGLHACCLECQHPMCDQCPIMEDMGEM